MTTPPDDTEPTTPPLPSHPSDDRPLSADEEAVHAVLDGTADHDQRRRVASRSDLAEALTALRAVRGVLADPPEAPEPGAVDAQLRRALATLDQVAGPTDAGTARTASATSPSRRHPRRRPRARRSSHAHALRWVSAAAVLVVVVVATVALGVAGREDRDHETASVGSQAGEVASDGVLEDTAGGSVSADAESGADAAPEAVAPSASGPGRVADQEVVDLGAVDLDALVDAVREPTAARNGSYAAAPALTSALGVAEACQAELVPDGTAVVMVGRATLDGRDVVFAVTTPEGAPDRTLRVVSADTCSLVFLGRL